MNYFSSIHIVFLSFLISSIALAQPSIKESSGIEYISSRTVNLLNDSNDYTGTPYFNKEFLKGNVLYKGKIIAANQDIRYNVSHEVFEIKSPANKSSKVVNTIAAGINDICTESTPSATPNLFAVCSIRILSAPNSSIITADFIIARVIFVCSS